MGFNVLYQGEIENKVEEYLIKAYIEKLKEEFLVLKEEGYLEDEDYFIVFDRKDVENFVKRELKSKFLAIVIFDTKKAIELSKKGWKAVI